MTRLLVTGGSGYLGGYVAQAAAAALPTWEVTPISFSRFSPHPAARRLDLTDLASVANLVQTLRPTAILHTACSNRDARNVGAIVPAARHLAQAAHEHGARLVHVSTDLVFDGEHAPFDDDARPAPVMEYGRAKAEAESVVACLCPSAAIARPSLIWALDPRDRQTDWLVQGILRGERVTLFTDEVRCPVHLADLTIALLELVQRPDIAGPLNLGGPQPLSRWDFGLRLLQALGLSCPPNVVSGTVAASGGRPVRRT